jgi:phosphoribosylformimino-5-aminoimidazole carboxamide ribotide isomerase
MELFPAIDVRGGAAVRLTQGDFDRQTDYGDPLALAESYIAGGTRWIHVVDLEAARTGVVHEGTVLAAIAALGPSVQAGGGIRTLDGVRGLLENKVQRVVMGTAALEEPLLATECARRWPGRVALGLDYRVGEDGGAEVLGHGWRDVGGRKLPEVLEQWEGEPFGAVVATSIARDGMLQGPDVEGMRALLAMTTIPVIASGGVGSLDDLRTLGRLQVEDRRLAGVIVGKALVECRFTVAEALDACAASA